MILPYMDTGRLEVDGSGHIVTPDNRLKTTVHIVIAILPEAKHNILQ